MEKCRVAHTAERSREVFSSRANNNDGLCRQRVRHAGIRSRSVPEADGGWNTPPHGGQRRRLSNSRRPESPGPQISDAATNNQICPRHRSTTPRHLVRKTMPLRPDRGGRVRSVTYGRANLVRGVPFRGLRRFFWTWSVSSF